MSQKFTFLFAPFDGLIGHVNVAIGIAQQLQSRGHKIVFAIPSSWNGKLEALGFTEHTLHETKEFVSHEQWVERLKYLAPVFNMSPLQKLEYFEVSSRKKFVEDAKNRDAHFRRIMAEVKPDVVIVDTIIQCPALVDNGVPWVLATATNTMTVAPENVPPAHHGFPIINGDKALWKEHAEQEKEVLKDVFADFKSWVMEKGGEELEYMPLPFWHKFSPYVNLYMFPEELSYTSFRPDPPNWHRVDAFMRNEEGTFELPAALQNLPGKLIYFSMGTIGCYELQLINKLLGIFGKSANRFIISKGPMGHELELPLNVWGETFVPQTKVIPLVDLVITHGGHNTITESFYFGKRILVLPLFTDQLDNGRRIEETGLGLQFHPYRVTEEELLSGIDKILGDELLEKRMKSISKRIQASNPQGIAADLIENVAKKTQLTQII